MNCWLWNVYIYVYLYIYQLIIGPWIFFRSVSWVLQLICLEATEKKTFPTGNATAGQ